MKLPEWLEKPDPEIYLDEDNYTCADFETSNKDKGSALERTNRIVLSTWLDCSTDEQIGIHPNIRSSNKLSKNIRSCFGDEYHQKELTDAISRSRFFIAHHSKFELQWLQRCGVDLSTILVWDTLLGEFVLAGNRRWDLSLDGCAKRYGIGTKENLVRGLIESGVCPSEIPEQWLLEYCSQDTLLCHQIFLKQRERIVNEGLLPVMFLRCLLTPVLADIEMNGIQLDAKRVEDEYNKTFSEFARTSENLSRFAGEINWGSPKQVAGFLYGDLGFRELHRNGSPDRTDADNPRTDSGTIEKLKPNNGRQKEFLRSFAEYKKLEKKLQNLEKLKACVDQDNGRLFAQYNQAVAATHRLSSSGLKYKVQFQNIDHTLKGLFTSRNKGWKIGEADAVQLEFRVLAHLTGDSVAASDIRNPGFDAHWQTAEHFLGKPRSQLTKEDRYDYKPETFRPCFTASIGKDGSYTRFFHDKYKEMFRAQTEWAREVLERKKLRTSTGLIFYWPDCEFQETYDGRGYISYSNAIFNYPVQSLAGAFMVPIALTFLWHRIKAMGLRAFIVNTVHDSVIAEIPPEEQDVFKDLSRRCFTLDCDSFLNSVFGISYSVPFGVETKIGTHWGSGEESKYDWDPIKQAA